MGGRCLWFPFQHGGWRTLPAAEGPVGRAPRGSSAFSHASLSSGKSSELKNNNNNNKNQVIKSYGGVNIFT